MMCASSVSRNTRSPATPTPRLALPAVTPGVRRRLNCQIMRPLPASSAMHSFGAVTYMTPPDTIGVFSNDPSLVIPVWKIMRGTSCETLDVLMLLSEEYRVFQSLPP